MYNNPEIYFVTIIGIVLGLLLVSFIIVMMVMYRRRQEKQEKEMASVKDMYEKEVLQSQLEIQEITFKNISQELHDNIGQMLSVVRLSLSALPLSKEHEAFPLVQHSAQVLNKAIIDLSDLTKSMHSDRITDLGLEECIRFELHSVKHAGLIDTVFNVNGREFPLPEQKAVFLFRMFQEILNNTLKHSAATEVMVALNFGGDNSFSMRVEDNGAGFDFDQKKFSTSAGKGVGLKSMLNRASLIGAEIDFKSKIGKGTSVSVSLIPDNT